MDRKPGKYDCWYNCHYCNCIAEKFEEMVKHMEGCKYNPENDEEEIKIERKKIGDKMIHNVKDWVKKNLDLRTAHAVYEHLEARFGRNNKHHVKITQLNNQVYVNAKPRGITLTITNRDGLKITEQKISSRKEII